MVKNLETKKKNEGKISTFRHNIDYYQIIKLKTYCLLTQSTS